MTKREVQMLTDLVEHEIFHAEAVVNTFKSKESNKHLNDLRAIFKMLQKSDGKLYGYLNKAQKELLVDLIKQAQLEARRVLDEREKIKKIQQDSSILNGLENSLYAT